MSDQLIRFVTRDSNFRVIAAETTTLCETARQLHGTDPTATVALARVTTGAALLGGLLKGSQRLALAIEANGPLQKLHAETDAAGHLRCSIKNSRADLLPRDNRFDVAGAIGRAGFLHIIKDLGLKEPYRGTVQLQTSEIGDDIAYYLTNSEQVPSSVALSVMLGNETEVKSAGGFIVQALPGCSDEEIREIEDRIHSLPAFSEQILDVPTLTDVMQKLFTGFDISPAESIPLSFRCNCSREQVSRMLKPLGQQELSGLVDNRDAIEVTCEYCRQAYYFSSEDVASSGD